MHTLEPLLLLCYFYKAFLAPLHELATEVTRTLLNLRTNGVGHLALGVSERDMVEHEWLDIPLTSILVIQVFHITMHRTLIYHLVDCIKIKV